MALWKDMYTCWSNLYFLVMNRERMQAIHIAQLKGGMNCSTPNVVLANTL
jgi:hypothetical protein